MQCHLLVKKAVSEVNCLGSHHGSITHVLYYLAKLASHTCMPVRSYIKWGQ